MITPITGQQESLSIAADLIAGEMREKIAGYQHVSPVIAGAVPLLTREYLRIRGTLLAAIPRQDVRFRVVVN